MTTRPVTGGRNPDPWLERQARERPNAPALDSLTYSELLAAARAEEPGEHPVGLHARWLRRIDPALEVFTSGTTAEPRAVHLGYDVLEAHANAVREALRLTPGDRWLCPLPLTHVAGLMILVRAVVVGFHALTGNGRTLERLMGGEATYVSLVPTQLRRLLDAGLQDPPGLRAVILGGAPVDPSLKARAADRGVEVKETYGMTETASMVAIDGIPLPGFEITIDGQEIVVDGPTTAGPLRTGDTGHIHDGRLVVTGRTTDTIITGGENVAPAAVEAALLQHPDVADAGVFGRPDPEWGEAVVAHVVARPGSRPDPAGLRDWCRDRLARHQVPKEITLVDVLPRTATGKLLRRTMC